MAINPDLELIFESEHFDVRAANGYVHTTSDGMSIEETERATFATIDYMRETGVSRLLFDVTDMSWINDMHGRMRRTELAAEAKGVLKRLAFVSKSASIRYLVKALTSGVGIGEIQSFSTIDDALEWLLRPDAPPDEELNVEALPE